MLVEKGCIETEAPKSNMGKAFALGFLKKLTTTGNVDQKEVVPVSNGDIDVDGLQKKLNKGEIDVEYLNQTLKPDCEFMLDDERLFYGDD